MSQPRKLIYWRGSPYALQGLFINPALNSLTAGSLNSAELSFADVNGSIKATLNFGGSSISTSDYSEPDTVLPNVSIAARNTQQSSDEVNRAVTITNGQLGRIEMGSYIPGDETPLSVELEGFFVKGKGLLLRFYRNADCCRGWWGWSCDNQFLLW